MTMTAVACRQLDTSPFGPADCTGRGQGRRVGKSEKKTPWLKGESELYLLGMSVVVERKGVAMCCFFVFN